MPEGVQEAGRPGEGESPCEVWVVCSAPHLCTPAGRGGQMGAPPGKRGNLVRGRPCTQQCTAPQDGSGRSRQWQAATRSRPLYSNLTTIQLPTEDQFLVYNSRGELAHRKGDQLQALYDLTIAASLKPRQWQPLITRSEAYKALHADSAAVEDIDTSGQLGEPIDKQALRKLQSSKRTVNSCLVLGVRGNGPVPCDPDHARQVWKQLLVKYHPDKKRFQEAKDSAHVVCSLLNNAVATFYEKRVDCMSTGCHA